MWKPKGVIFDKHHAQLPTPIYIGNGLIRIYYSTKVDKKSHIRFFDINESNLELVSEDKEALSPGNGFDHAGVMPSSIADNTMYFTGWHLKKRVPYGHAIGVAKINEDGTLEREPFPIISGNNIANSPCIVDKNYMLYCRGTGWIKDYPIYHISSARKKDGYWVATNEKIIYYDSKTAISRVSKDGNCFYYSWKTKDTPYQIAKFESGKKTNIDIERAEWDSEMQCYPFVYENNGYRYLFYNGNQYGKTGIGVAYEQ